MLGRAGGSLGAAAAIAGVPAGYRYRVTTSGLRLDCDAVVDGGDAFSTLGDLGG